MKKLLAVAFAIVAIVLSAPAKAEAAYNDGYALGVGFNYNYVGTHAMGVYITGKTSWLPIMMGVSLDFYEIFSVNVSGDYWAWNPSIISKEKFDWDFYLGIGNTFSYDSYGNSSVDLETSSFDPLADFYNLKFSGRITLGFSWRIAKKYEIFTEGVVNVHIINYACPYGLSDNKEDDASNEQLMSDAYFGGTSFFKILGINFAGSTYEDAGVCPPEFNIWHLFSFGANVGFRYWF